jgi:4-hydroxymandelate oxidase
MQIFWGHDRGQLRETVERAASAGAAALCLTVTLPVRPWLRGDMLRAWADLSDQPTAMRGRWFQHDEHPYSAKVTWSDLEWLRGISPLPLVLKGVMRDSDARLAAEHGVDAVFVSNHGGQALEHCAPTAEALPRVVDALDGRAEVLVDGGIRSGTDVLRALALGARAALVGRPALWGLALGGADGVAGVLDLLRGELETSMAMCGARDVSEIDRTLVSVLANDEGGTP